MSAYPICDPRALLIALLNYNISLLIVITGIKLLRLIIHVALN